MAVKNIVPAFVVVVICLLLIDLKIGQGAYPQRVLLHDVHVLTLHRGQMTNGRRSSPVPQLKCVGGSAGCYSFVPEVVQCTNKGNDGNDFQWECKADMDNKYRFGKIEVTCEGFDYPDDPYILAGSCGLEYYLESTGGGGGGGGEGGSGGYSYGNNKKGSSTFGNVIILVIVIGVVLYAINKYMQTSGGQNATGYQSQSAPPPAGFRPEYMPGGTTYGSSTYGSGTGSSSSGGYYSSSAPNANSGPGFWSGAATGGFLGYLFGSRNNANNYGYGGGSSWGNRGSYYGNTGGSTWGGNTGSTWGGNTWASGSSSSSSSSGTRTASGFGGTKRR